MKFLFFRWKYLSTLEEKFRILTRPSNILHVTCNVYGTLFIGWKNSQYVQYRSKVSWQSLEIRSSILENFKDRDASRVSRCSRYEFRDVQDASFVTSLKHLETRKRRNFRVINFSHVYICVSFTPSEK